MSRLSTTLFLSASSALMAPVALAADKSTPWHLDSTNWTFLTLILFLLLIWKLGAFKAIGNMLDGRANEIQRELDHAQQLREEASALLKEAERKQQEASDMADTILRQAETDAKALMEQAEKDLTDMVARREAQVEARINRAENEATQAVKEIAADAATKAAADLIRTETDRSKGQDAFTTALAQVKGALQASHQKIRF